MNLVFSHPEFEREVREDLQIFDRPITNEDALLVTELCLDFCFKEEDVATLLHFRNLKSLAIETILPDYSFLGKFEKVEELFFTCFDHNLDFNCFSTLENLNYLLVSGGDYSDIAFKNLEALANLERLRTLILHEFGSIDLAPLANMKQIKTLAIEYTNNIENIETIGSMTWLEELNLTDIPVQNLDFLDTLSPAMRLELCGIRILDENSFNLKKLKRFTNRDICEIQIGEHWSEFIDLSELND